MHGAKRNKLNWRYKIRVMEKNEREKRKHPGTEPLKSSKPECWVKEKLVAKVTKG